MVETYGNFSVILPNVSTIGKNSIIGAGSVITRNVKQDSLAITRAFQNEIKNYKRKKKK